MRVWIGFSGQDIGPRVQILYEYKMDKENIE